MKLIEENIAQTLEEIYIIETLNLNNKTILELGCGKASMTREIARSGFGRKIVACEVDKIQHEKNLKENISNIEFKLCGAENLPFDNESFDIIFMFKSFHHIPVELMDKAIDEIQRVLKPNGLVYISEPLFTGALNEILSIFHNEEEVRKKAFETIEKAVKEEKFKLFKEVFFQTETSFENYSEFEKRHMNQTFNSYVLTDEIKHKVKEKFDNINGGYRTTFMKPFRIDILQKQ